MAEKEGQVVEPTEADPKDQTPKDDATPEEEPQDQVLEVPEEFKGKTDGDLIKEIQASQKELGKQSKEVGELRNSLEYEKQMRELATQRAETGNQPPPAQVPRVDWNYEKPVESVEQIISQKLNEREGLRQQNDLRQAQVEAQSNYAEGRRLSMSQNPTIFEGVEREVENAVYGAYMNRTIGIHELRNPEAWVTAAQLIHLKNNNIDRLQPANIRPVETVSTELPNPAKPGSTEKPFTGLDYTDEGTQKMVKQYGLTKEEAEEIVKAEQERVAGGGK
jgi:hypothetical protein